MGGKATTDMEIGAVHITFETVTALRIHRMSNAYTQSSHTNASETVQSPLIPARYLAYMASTCLHLAVAEVNPIGPSYF